MNCYKKISNHRLLCENRKYSIYCHAGKLYVYKKVCLGEKTIVQIPMQRKNKVIVGLRFLERLFRLEPRFAYFISEDCILFSFQGAMYHYSIERRRLKEELRYRAGMNNTGMNAISVLNYLRERVGDEGTLVLPTFPIYNEKNCREKGVYVYNPQKTASATGLMTNIFLRMPGVVRSRFPWNTLAAQGPLALSMMEKNMESDLAHGKNSSWEYCMNHHAKILLLGVRASHTTTMVHVAEDILDEAWPIKNWYESKTFYIQEDKKEEKRGIHMVY